MAIAKATSFESQEYWDSRYLDATQRKSELFDWYLLSFENLKPFLAPLLVQSTISGDAVTAVLDVGAGNSPFIFDVMHFLLSEVDDFKVREAAARQKFVATDFSSVVVEQQKALIEKRESWAERVEFVNADARYSLGVDLGSVGFVMDKATLDAVDCGEDMKDSVDVAVNCLKALVEGGYFTSLTCRPVSRRLQTIEEAIKTVDFKVEPVGVHSLKNDPVSPSHLLIFRRCALRTDL